MARPKPGAGSVGVGVVGITAFCRAGAMSCEPPRTSGTVWVFSNIQVEPGQFERYLDYLSGDWKKLNEFGKKEGYVVSYHVLSVNNTRGGEPDLVLAVEQDCYTNAERLAQQKRLEAFVASDTRKMDSATGERKVLRKRSAAWSCRS